MTSIHPLLRLFLLCLFAPTCLAVDTSSLKAFDLDGLSAGKSVWLEGEALYVEELLPPEQALQYSQWQTIQLPHAWLSPWDKVRTGSYLLRITQPADFGAVPALKVNQLPEAFNLYLLTQTDTTLLYKNGKVSASMDQHHAGLEKIVIPLAGIGADSYLLFQVSSAGQSYESGPYLSLEISSLSSSVVAHRMDLYSRGLSVGALLMLTMYHSLIFFRNRSQYASLWLAIACALVALRSFVAYGHLEALTYQWVNSILGLRARIEYLTVFVTVGAFLQFFWLFFPRRINHNWVKIIHSLTAGLALLSLFVPVWWLAQHLWLLQSVALINIVLLLGIIGFASYHNDADARTVLIAAIVVISGVLADIASTYSDQPAFFVTEYLLLIWMIVQSDILARRYAQSERGVLSLKHKNFQLQQQRQKAERDAEIDTLTQLLNRRGFENGMSAIWTRAQHHQYQVSLILIDLDHFKALNDRYGHLIGDEILKQVGLFIAAFKTEKECLMARWGGEEFVICLEDTELTEATEYAERLRQQIAAKTWASSSGDHINFTVSIGIGSSIPQAEQSYRSVFVNSDQALYHAKAQGRNCVVAQSTTVAI